MPGNLTANRVLSGIYSGFTKTEMQAEWERYKTALTTQTGGRLQGATINGQNYQFGPRSDMTLASWGKAIRSALSQVDPSWAALPGQTMYVRFGDGCNGAPYGPNGNGGPWQGG